MRRMIRSMGFIGLLVSLSAGAASSDLLGDWDIVTTGFAFGGAPSHMDLSIEEQDGEVVAFIYDGPVPIRIELPAADKASAQSLLDLKVAASDGSLVALSEFVSIVNTQREISIYHKDLMPVVFVTADMAGELDSPLYGMFDIRSQLMQKPLLQGEPLQQNLLGPPLIPPFQEHSRNTASIFEQQIIIAIGVIKRIKIREQKGCEIVDNFIDQLNGFGIWKFSFHIWRSKLYGDLFDQCGIIWKMRVG